MVEKKYNYGKRHAKPERNFEKSMTNKHYVPIHKQVARMIGDDSALYDTKAGEKMTDEILDREDKTRSSDYDLVDRHNDYKKVAAALKKAKQDKINQANEIYKAGLAKLEADKKAKGAEGEAGSAMKSDDKSGKIE